MAYKHSKSNVNIHNYLWNTLLSMHNCTDCLPFAQFLLDETMSTETERAGSN